MHNGPARTERITGESEGKEALEMMAEEVVEGRYALIGGGEAAFFWIAWRQASRGTRDVQGAKRANKTLWFLTLANAGSRCDTF